MLFMVPKNFAKNMEKWKAFDERTHAYMTFGSFLHICVRKLSQVIHAFPRLVSFSHQETSMQLTIPSIQGRLENSMALQAGVNTSKVLILVGAGLSGSVLLRSGQLSGLIAQLQELLKGVDDAEILPGRYDAALIAAQIRQLAQEIRELTLSHPVTIFNANSSSSGGISSYLLPAAAIGAMGYCYMWWRGWSFSDVMFVTKRNMVNAVEIVSKQLEMYMKHWHQQKGILQRGWKVLT
ncbi:hypothetical protein VNO80_30619 [Phaseolus coccineus]|uniref:DUF1664 domain-containing protein n=1 Tax=Phaseolus coccineus TaxID=3886 RepID=A0AAN9LDA5_PHACN